MKLILNGDAKNTQGSKQGIYILGEKLVNSYPYWYQQNGSNALWFDRPFREWTVESKSYLGLSYGGIIGPRGIDRSPTRIASGWKYYENGIWKDATASEIMFRDLSPSKHFYKSLIQYETIRFLYFQWLMTSVK